jgi:CHAD domain-containing protein
MPFRFKHGDDSPQEAVRRIADEQVQRALREIDDSDLSAGETIHQVRKRCKKVRGLLRLVRPAFDGYKFENTAFRDIARPLSDLRDAHALIETYDAVAARFDDSVDRRSFAPIRARLTQDAKRVAATGDAAERLGAAQAELAAARERIGDWSLDKKGYKAVRDGLKKTYKRSRNCMQDAWRAPSGKALHQWRKRVKYHWHHTRLLEEIHPDMMQPRIDALDRLTDLLGDQHDLVVFEARFEDADDFGGPATDLPAFLALVRQQKAELETEAFQLGRQVLAERRKALVKRLGGYWNDWRDDRTIREDLLVKA